MIAVGSTDLPDGVTAIRNLGKHNRTVRLGGGLLNLGILGVEQTEDRAGQRLAVVLCLFQLHPIQIIPDHGIAGDLAVRSDGEGFDGDIQRIAGRRVGFLEGVGAGHNGNVGDFTLAVGVFAVDGIAIRVIHFDQRAGQLFRTGNVRLGDGDGRIDQVIQDGVFQIHGDHVFAGCLIGTGQLHGILFRAQQPALGHGDFLHVVIPMREHAGEGQVALGVGRAGSHQGIGRQLLIVTIGDDGIVVQAEHKALAGNHFNGLVNHALLGLGQLQVFLFLAQRHADRKKGIGSGDLDLNNRSLFINGRKSDIVGRRVKHIAFWSGNLLQVILAQGQDLGLDCAGGAGGQLFHQLVLLIEGGAFLADNVLRRVQLEDRAGQIAVLIHGLHHSVAVGILFIRKAHQLHAALFQHDVTAHRCVCDIHGDGRGLIRGVGTRNLKAAEQHDHCHHQVKKAFHLEHISILLSYLIQTVVV